jgi:hypothetical protein
MGGGEGKGRRGGGDDQQSRLINILSQHAVMYMEMRGIYIEQIIYVNTHIQQLIFNQNLMKRNKEKNLMRK